MDSSGPEEDIPSDGPEEDGPSDDEDLKIAVEDLLKAISSKDVDGTIDALRMAFNCLKEDVSDVSDDGGKEE